MEKKTLPSHVARLNGLDAARSKRIYKALSKLSDKAVLALTNKDMRSFSISTDKMRPLMSYILTNSVTLSEYVTKGNIQRGLDEKLLMAELHQRLNICRLLMNHNL